MLLARSLKSRLIDNSTLQTEDGDNAIDLCGFEFYWWKLEILEQKQVKAYWNRYWHQNQIHDQSSNITMEQTLSYKWSEILIKLKEILFTCYWLNTN
jgi:hypothetical protein